MDLAEWDKKVKPHLAFIQSGAEMAARHARALAVRPNFETMAESELSEARKTLETALANLARAEAAYHAKPLEVSHAA